MVCVCICVRVHGLRSSLTFFTIPLLISATVPTTLSNVTFYLRFSSVYEGILPTQYVDVNGTLEHIENMVKQKCLLYAHTSNIVCIRIFFNPFFNHMRTDIELCQCTGI